MPLFNKQLTEFIYSHASWDQADITSGEKVRCSTASSVRNSLVLALKCPLDTCLPNSTFSNITLVAIVEIFISWKLVNTTYMFFCIIIIISSTLIVRKKPQATVDTGRAMKMLQKGKRCW